MDMAREEDYTRLEKWFLKAHWKHIEIIFDEISKNKVTSFSEIDLSVKEKEKEKIIKFLLKKEYISMDKECYKLLDKAKDMLNKNEEIKNNSRKNTDLLAVRTLVREKLRNNDVKSAVSLLFEYIRGNSLDLDLVDVFSVFGKEHISKVFYENHFYSIISDEKEELWVYINGVYKPVGKAFIRDKVDTILREDFSENIVKKVIEKAIASCYIDPKHFFINEHPNIVALKNGLLNLETKELKQFSPKYIFFSKLPVEYDPDAKCPKIEEHLESVLKNEHDKKLIEEMVGFCLYKKYRPEKAFMLVGDGRNGKSKTVELIKCLIGVDNCSNIPLKRFEEDRFSFSELFGKMANLGSDIARTKLRDTSNFRALTGNDIISAPRKFKTSIQFVNYAKMIFCANELPRAVEDTNAFFMRWKIIEFPFTFVSKKEFDLIPDKNRGNYRIANPHIMDDLSDDEELSGLLNLAIDGLHRIWENGRFSDNKMTEQIKREWIKRSDSFRLFVDETFEAGAEEDYISKNDLRIMYFDYCNKHNLKRCGDKHIKSVVTFMGGSDARLWDGDKHIYVWKHLRFKDNQQRF